MARPARQLANARCRALLGGLLFLSSGSLAGCQPDPLPALVAAARAVPMWRWLGDVVGPSHRTLDAESATLTLVRGRLLQRGQPFSGTIVDRRDPRYGQKTSYARGLRHGLAAAWYADGRVAYERHFVAGLRQGLHVGFWPDGSPQFRYRYRDDVFEGEQEGFYRGGALLERRHYRAGQEEGRQQIWDAQGRLSSNYMVKGGRRYGLVGSFDCVTVH